MTEDPKLAALVLAAQRSKLITRKPVNSPAVVCGFKADEERFEDAAETLPAFQNQGAIEDDDNGNGTSKEKEIVEAEQAYFGSMSHMNEESLRSSPRTVVEVVAHDNCSAWDNGFADHRNEGDVNQGLGADTRGGVWGGAQPGWINSQHGWGSEAAEIAQGPGMLGNQHPEDDRGTWGAPTYPAIQRGGNHQWGTPHCPQVGRQSTSSGPTKDEWDSTYRPNPGSVPERANEASGSGGAGWEYRGPVQQFETQAGDNENGLGTCGAGHEPADWWNAANSNRPHAWDYNVEDGKVFDTDNQRRRPSHVRSRHPSLVQNVNHGKSGARASPPLSEATVRQFPRGQLPPQPPQDHPLPDLSREFHTHYHHHTYDHHQQKANSQSQNETQLVQELREQNSSRAELLTEQRIRIAILENELKHMKKEIENAVNASIMIAQKLSADFLGPSSTSHSVIEEQASQDQDVEVAESKHDLERLRKDNATLENFLEDSIKNFEGHVSTVEDDNQHVPNSSANSKARGKARVTEPSKSHASDAPKKKRAPGGLQAAYEKEKAITRLQRAATEPFDKFHYEMEMSSLESDTEIKGINGWNESLSSDITTVLDSPHLNASIASNSSAASAYIQLSDNSPKTNRFSDVGIHSLDEILDGNMETLEIPQPAPISSKKFEPLSTQIRTNMKAMLSFDNVPAPLVLKTGFDINHAKQGAKYDHLFPQAELRHGVMCNNNRFDASSTANRYASTSTQIMWNSAQERNRTFHEHQYYAHRDGTWCPDMVRYGIQYVPQEDDENYLRTVCISNLPSDVQLRDVLARVRGGLIANAILMDTKTVMNGAMSAMIFFLESYDAAAFVEYTSKHPVAFGLTDDAITATVALVPTPTYPLSQGIVWRMKQDKTDTRCLTIKNFPPDLSPSKVQHDIAHRNGHRADSLVEFYLDAHKTLHLEFSNISLAGLSFAILTNVMLYNGLEVNFAPDPCAGPLEELLLPLPNRPPMLPRVKVSSYPNEDSSMASYPRFPMEFVTQTGARVSVNSAHSSQTQQVIATQPVFLPLFSGTGIKSSSWADEVIETSSSSSNMAPTFTNTNNMVDHVTERADTCELPHTHSKAPPNSPIDDMTTMDNLPELEVEGMADSLLMENANMLMKERPAAFHLRNPPVCLTGTKYSTAVPKYKDDLPEGFAGGIKLKRIAVERANEGGDTTELLREGGGAAKGLTTSEKGKERALDHDHIPLSTPEPRSSHGTALGSDEENSPDVALPELTSTSPSTDQSSHTEGPPTAPRQADLSILTQSLHITKPVPTRDDFDGEGSGEKYPSGSPQPFPAIYNLKGKSKATSSAMDYKLSVPKPQSVDQDWTANMEPAFPAEDTGRFASFNHRIDGPEDAEIARKKARGYVPCMSFGQKAWSMRNRTAEEIRLDAEDAAAAAQYIDFSRYDEQYKKTPDTVHESPCEKHVRDRRLNRVRKERSIQLQVSTDEAPRKMREDGFQLDDEAEADIEVDFDQTAEANRLAQPERHAKEEKCDRSRHREGPDEY